MFEFRLDPCLRGFALATVRFAGLFRAGLEGLRALPYCFPFSVTTICVDTRKTTMSDAARFISRFAVGHDGKAYSAVWRVWTARKQPDLYIAVRGLGGEFEATVCLDPYQDQRR
jgi:hypothetical protein